MQGVFINISYIISTALRKEEVNVSSRCTGLSSHIPLCVHMCTITCPYHGPFPKVTILSIHVVFNACAIDLQHLSVQMSDLSIRKIANCRRTQEMTSNTWPKTCLELLSLQPEEDVEHTQHTNCSTFSFHTRPTYMWVFFLLFGLFFKLKHVILKSISFRDMVIVVLRAVWGKVFGLVCFFSNHRLYFFSSHSVTYCPAIMQLW